MVRGTTVVGGEEGGREEGFLKFIFEKL